MAFPSSFDESNAALSPPVGVSEEDCEALSICRTTDGRYPVVITCWKFTADELEEINRTGRVWVGVMGESMPPLWVAGLSPFERNPP